MKLILENWRLFIQNLNEEFFFVSDKEFKNAVTQQIVNAVASRLPGLKTSPSLDPLKASGAEGIVLSLDDKRVIKMFHSLDNAAKNLPLVSKNMPETAQVYSVGKLVLDQPVVYYKKGSSYSPTDVKPTKEIFYIIMQRVKPDPFIYNYVELEYEKFNRVSSLSLDKLILLNNIKDETIKKRAQDIFSVFIKSIEQQNIPFNSLDSFISDATRKQKNRLNQQFNVWRKKFTKDYVLNINNKRVLLKKLILNFLGIENDLPFAKKYMNFFINQPELARTPKKSMSSNTLRQDLIEIMSLIKKIRIDKNTPWNDIHKEQFGRDLQNNLIALDLGVKGDSNISVARNAFNKNVTKISTKGQEFKIVTESEARRAKKKAIKTINVFDFDRTLFNTHGEIEGKRKYEKVFNKSYPHIGWFGKEESLSDELDIQPIDETHKFFNSLSTLPNSKTILISDRTFQLKDRMGQFLSDRGLHFDAILLKKGASTKRQRLEEYWENYEDVVEINIFDDLDKALDSYLDLKRLYSIYRDDLKINIFKISGQKVKNYEKDI